MEQERIRRALAGDPAAFEWLVKSRTQRIYWTARRIVLDPDDAEDIAQKAFVQLWEKRRLYDPALSFDAWLRKMTVNLALDHLRHRKRLEAKATAAAEARPSPSSQEDDLLQGELEAIYERLAATLPSQQRAVFVMRIIEQRSTGEIAAALGTSESTVRNHLMTARRKVREELKTLFPDYLRDPETE